MAGEGESKTVATTPAMTPLVTLPTVNSPIPATEASMEDVATFVQPLAMIPAEENSGGPVGATLRTATQSFSKTSQQQTCRAIYKEQIKINLVFF